MTALLALAWALSAPVPGARQSRHPRARNHTTTTHAAATRAAEARAAEARERLLLRTAQADLRAGAYDGASRNFQALLQIEPDNAAARSGLQQSDFESCRALALPVAGRGAWAEAARDLEACPAWPPAAAARAADIAMLQRLQAVETALQREDWSAAATAMRQLVAAPASADMPELNATMAPAYLAYAADPARARPAALPALPQAGPFAAFLRDRARRRALRAAALPLLAIYAVVLLLSLFLGLLALPRRVASLA